MDYSNQIRSVVFMKNGKKNIQLIFAMLFLIFFNPSELSGQLHKGKNKSETTSNIAAGSEAWDMLFVRNEGWFGGDGIFGIPLDGKEFLPASDDTVTLFTFGDTMVGTHDGKKLANADYRMINNSIGLLKGGQPNSHQISFHYNLDDHGGPKSLFIPKTEHSKEGDYYWLGDGFVNNEGDGNLYIFAYPIQPKDTTGIGGFGFEQIGVHILKIPLEGDVPNFDKTEQIETPHFNIENQTSFGSAIYVNTKSAGAPDPDGYIYIYGVSNQNERKGLLVARVLSSDFLYFDKWRFWDGHQWLPHVKDAAFITWDVSNEMSVSPLPNGKILLVYQYFTMSDEVSTQIGTSLKGPFNERKTIYHVPKETWREHYFPYNAKAYPHLSTQDSILISYNVNSFDFFNDILNDPNLYRPRFINVAVRDVE